MKIVLKIVLFICIISAAIIVSSLDYYNRYHESDNIYFEKDNIISAFSTLVFTLLLIVLFQKKLSNYDYYKTDCLLYRPKWIKSLGTRRLLSVFTNATILTGIISLVILAFLFLFDKPSSNDMLSLVTFTFCAYLLFWFTWLLVSLIYWIKQGFKE
ncbi:MAG: hypothetical protein COA97_03450 [Flavobacteriales bacterium]|nr:MAG: hypothetical protein COA97_03450 [Flavobacteriales bacterium]